MLLVLAFADNQDVMFLNQSHDLACQPSEERSSEREGVLVHTPAQQGSARLRDRVPALVGELALKRRLPV